MCCLTPEYLHFHPVSFMHWKAPFALNIHTHSLSVRLSSKHIPYMNPFNIHNSEVGTLITLILQIRKPESQWMGNSPMANPCILIWESDLRACVLTTRATQEGDSHLPPPPPIIASKSFPLLLGCAISKCLLTALKSTGRYDGFFSQNPWTLTGTTLSSQEIRKSV